MQEQETRENSLFSEISAEESATINGAWGRSYGYNHYRPVSYHYVQYYPRRHYRPCYYY